MSQDLLCPSKTELFDIDLLQGISIPFKTEAVIINNPDSPVLSNMVEFLTVNFKPGEVEDRSVFGDELERSNKQGSKVKFIGIAVNDPDNIEDPSLACVAYGSVQADLLAVKFTLTEIRRRGSGISLAADHMLMDIAGEEAKLRGNELKFMMGECVSKSEGYWNKLGMKRIYYADTGEEFRYFMLPTAWNRDGTPASDCIEEHIQIAQLKDLENPNISTRDLCNCIQEMCTAWYIRGPENFESNEAYLRHLNIVKSYLREILEPLKSHEYLILKAKAV